MADWNRPPPPSGRGDPQQTRFVTSSKRPPAAAQSVARGRFCFGPGLGSPSSRETERDRPQPAAPRRGSAGRGRLAISEVGFHAPILSELLKRPPKGERRAGARGV